MKPIFPCDYISITQVWGANTYSHKYNLAIDFVGPNNKNNYPVIAPCDMICKKKYLKAENEVWYQSTEPVEWANGEKDYFTILLGHCNDISAIVEGKTYKQGEVIYWTGTKGNVSGPHCHMEVGRGVFTGSGWFKNAHGVWQINNPVAPQEVLWIKDGSNVVNLNGIYFNVDNNVQPVEPEMPQEKTFNVGDTIKIIGKYASNKNGDCINSKGIGWTRQILQIVDGKNPYRVGNETGTTGYTPITSIERV